MSNFDDLSGIWETVKSSFLSSMSKDAVNLWFGDMTITGFDGDTLTLSTPSDLKYSMVNKKYIENLHSEFSNYLGFDVKVKVELLQKKEEPQEKPAEPDTNPGSPFMPPLKNHEFTFDTFIEGSSNKFALAACTAVAEHPATNYNPLFIYGPSGIGKTHLMYAITNKIQQDKPNVNIVFVKFEEFLNQFIDAVTNAKKDEFHKLYRECDILIIDDIHGIAGKVETENEFFNIFNTLYENKKQIILTSDRPPREMKTLADRLKTRFEWGLLADIQPPDLELRMAIIKKKAELYNLTLSDAVLQFLAENLRSNIRQLEGAIKKLAADHFLNGSEINIDKARECIADLIDGQIPIDALINRCFAASFEKYGVTKDDLVGSKRTKDIANARHVTIYVIRNSVDISLPHIGKIFNRDHTTVMSSIDNVENRMKTDRNFRREVEELIKAVKN